MESRAGGHGWPLQLALWGSRDSSYPTVTCSKWKFITPIKCATQGLASPTLKVFLTAAAGESFPLFSERDCLGSFYFAKYEYHRLSKGIEVNRANNSVG